MTILSAASLLFLVMDPVGNVPLFLTTLRHVEPRRRRAVLLRELLIALAALVVFLLAGPYILRALGISEPSLTIAGGIILFLIALRMIFPTPGGVFGGDEIGGEPFVVPLAIPLVAGPSSLASVLFIMNQDPARWAEWLAALLLAWAVSSLILLLSAPLSRFLGRRGLSALERLMGMVLTAVAVQMFMTGIRTFLAGPT